MIKKYNQWFDRLTSFQKLLVSFSLNWIFWLIAWLLAEQFIFEEYRSWNYHIFHATWMSFFMTIPLNWKELKQLFKSEK